MRLTPEDRRTLDRRLRNRLAPMLKSKLVNAPMAFAITVTIWLSPAALARVEAGADLRLSPQTAQVADESQDQSFSSEELKQKPPVPVEDLESTLSSKVIELINLVGKSKGGQAIRENYDSISEQEYFDREEFALDQREIKADMGQIREGFRKGSKKDLGNHVTKNLEIWQKVKDGFDFKLDFSRLWKSGKAPKAKKEQGSIRYGLVLKDVVPQENKEYQQAAIGSTLEEEMSYAGKADVVWTIGPISDKEQQEKPFAANYEGGAEAGSETGAGSSSSASADPTAASDDGSSPSEDVRSVKEGERPEDLKNHYTMADGMFTRAPSGSFSGNFKPNSMEYEGGQIPGLTMTLTQEQNLYSYSITTNNQFGKDSGSHSVTLPIIGNLSVGRRYNDKMELEQTSLSNILVSRRAPSLSVHYMEKTQQYQTVGSIKKDDYKLSMKAQSEAQSPKEGAEQDEINERYWLEFEKNF